MNLRAEALPISVSFIECFYRINTLFTTAISSGKCDEKYPFSNNNGTIHFVLLFHFSVSWSSEIQFHMLHLKTWASMQTHIPFRTLEFHSCSFACSGKHTGPISLPFQGSVFFVSFQLADGWAVFLV